MRSKSGEGDVAVSGPKAKSFRSRTMGSWLVGYPTVRSKCEYERRRGLIESVTFLCPRSPGLDFRSCLGGFAMDSLIRSVR
jgi:hypothetical protein